MCELSAGAIHMGIFCVREAMMAGDGRIEGQRVCTVRGSGRMAMKSFFLRGLMAEDVWQQARLAK
jgi:hypothetical protein